MIDVHSHILPCVDDGARDIEETFKILNEACDAGRVLINGKPAKASAQVKAGDILEIQFGSRTVRVEVLDVQETVKKEAASELFKYL